MKTSLLLDHAPAADGGTRVHALLRIDGVPPAVEGRVPLNLALVLDRSGSMAGAKLRAAREAAIDLIRRLSPEDRVGVVAYDDGVMTVAPPATGAEQEGIGDRIRALTAGGSTNLSGGWIRGYELVQKHLRQDGVNRVLLLTDGLANQGITDPAKLVELTANAARGGTSTTTLGFGDGYHEDLLRAMADAGGGATYYIERPDQATGIFQEELQGILSLCAQNLRVHVHPDRHADAARVLHDYPRRQEGDVLTLEVGDLYAREPRKVLMEFHLPAGVSGEAWVATVGVEAHVPTADGALERRTVDLPIRFHPEEGGSVEPEVRREVVLVAAARARDEALEARKRGDRERALSTLLDVVDAGGDLAEDDPEVAEELRDLEATARRLEADELREADVKYMKQRSYSTHRSRRQSLDRYRRDS